MKKILGIILLIFPVINFAEEAQTTQMQTLSPPLLKGCELARKAFNWVDGDSLSLESVQTILKSIKLPPGWSMDPQSAIDKVMSLATTSTPNVIYHCRDVATPPALATFYFSFFQDNAPVRTPDITVFAPLSAAPASPVVPVPQANAPSSTLGLPY